MTISFTPKVLTPPPSSPHAPPPYPPAPSLSPSSSHHTSPKSPASSCTPQTASHPCASQSETSPSCNPHRRAQYHTGENKPHQAHSAAGSTLTDPCNDLLVARKHCFLATRRSK